MSHARCRWVALALALVWPATHADAQGALRKGPYWMDVETARATVMVELSSAATVRVRLARDDFEDERTSEANVLHALTFDSLSPATRYEWTLWVGDHELDRGRITTASASEQTHLRFAVYGDNRSNPAAHHAVAEAVRGDRPEFVLNTGDMVYMGADLDDWQGFFEQARALYRETPIFPVLGNHELFPRGQGLGVYRRYVRTPGMDEEGTPYYRFDWGCARFLVLDSNGELAEGSPQRRWLLAELERAREDHVAHLFAAMHHGPFSSGYHGANERLVLEGLEDLLRAGGVELVFSGHDHLYERGEAAGLKYVVSGGGGAPLYGVNRREPYQLAFVPDYHYVSVEVEGPRVTLQTRLADGTPIERCAYEGRGPFVCDSGGPRGPVRGSESPARFYLERALPWLLLVAALGVGVWLWRRRRHV